MRGGISLKKVNFAIAGCGFIAAKHLAALSTLPDCQLAAVHDLDIAAAQKLASLAGAVVYQDYADLLADPCIDVVNICTPGNLHSALGIEAARHGKHVLVEKPLAVDLAQADALIEACARAGVMLLTAHQNRYKPVVQALKVATEQGGLGTISHGSAVLRWNRNMDYYTQKLWRGDATKGGGVLLNQAIHNIDLLQWMLGPVTAVYGHTSRTNLSMAEENAVAILHFASGALGLIEASSSVYPENIEETLAVFGTKGTVILSGKSIGQVKVWRIEGETNIPSDCKYDPVDPGGYRPLFQNLIECIRTGNRPLVDGREGRKSLEIITAIKQVATTGQPVRLPLI